MSTLAPGTTGHYTRSVGPRLQILSGYHLNEPNQPRWAAGIDSATTIYSGQIVSKTAAGLAQVGVVQGANSTAARISQQTIAIAFDDSADAHVQASGRIVGVPITAGIHAIVQTPWFNKDADVAYPPGTWLIADGTTGRVKPLAGNYSVSSKWSSGAQGSEVVVTPDTAIFRYPIIGIVDRVNQPENVASVNGHPFVTSATPTTGTTAYTVNTDGASNAYAVDVEAVRVLTFRVIFNDLNTASA